MAREVEAKWDDGEGYVSYAYGANEAEARERMIELFEPQFDKPNEAREYVRENEDYMMTYTTITERSHEEG